MTLIIELPPEKEAALKAQAQAAGMSAEEFARQALDAALPSAPPDPEETAGQEETIGQMIRRIVGDPPPEELAKLPSDSASQVDHYLYGAPKE